MAEYDFVWTPLSASSMQRLQLEKYAPVDVFHYGENGEIPPCTPQRLTALRARANATLEALAPAFAEEAKRLGRERHWILGIVAAIAVLIVVVASFVTAAGFAHIAKSLLSVGGSGGLLTWGVILAFRRVDQETQLKLFPSVFAAQFSLCTDCDGYEKTFTRFVKATDGLRGR